MTQLKPFDDLFAVPIPKGAKITEVKQVKQSACLIIETAPKEISIQPIKGNWQHLFTTESATEQDWAWVVESELKSVGRVWLDYTQPETVKRPYKFDYATESGHSLLAANGLEGNYAIVKKSK